MNPHRSDTLELFSCAPDKPHPAAPPLLFLHGAYTAAWCWQEHFLPFFAAAGFHSHALSFSGHGQSRRRDQLDHYSIADYIGDVAEAIADLPAPPVLIGHSMGGFVVQKYLERHAAPAAVLMCSVPPHGLAAPAIGMLFGRPSLFSDLNLLMSGGQVALESLRQALFAQPVPIEDLTRYYRMAQPESHRAIWDMMLFNLPRPDRVLANLPGGRDDLLIIGAEHDLIIQASLVEMTARSYGTQATIFSGMGHGLMLEADWRIPAHALLDWLNAHFGPDT
jgi:pimeloyl-ACP methyl ester carboxylesterase